MLDNLSNVWKVHMVLHNPAQELVLVGKVNILYHCMLNGHDQWQSMGIAGDIM